MDPADAIPLPGGGPREPLHEPCRRRLGAGWAAAAPYLRIILVFVVLGPPIGGLLLLGLPMTVALVFSPSYGELLPTLPLVLLVSIFSGYVLGWVAALAAGLVVALQHLQFGGARPFVAAASGALAGIVLAPSPFSRLILQSDAVLAALAAVGAMASLACWWIATQRGRVRR
jgi:hypothetical protein